jgi:hypothetical protein
MSDYFKTPLSSSDPSSEHFGLDSVIQHDMEDDEEYNQKIHLSSIQDFQTTTPSLATPATPMVQTPMHTPMLGNQTYGNDSDIQIQNQTTEITPQLQFGIF